MSNTLTDLESIIGKGTTLTPDQLKNLSFSFGKPLTESEFLALKRKNPAVVAVKGGKETRVKKAEDVKASGDNR